MHHENTAFFVCLSRHNSGDGCSGGGGTYHRGGRFGGGGFGQKCCLDIL